MIGGRFEEAESYPLKRDYFICLFFSQLGAGWRLSCTQHALKIILVHRKTYSVWNITSKSAFSVFLCGKVITPNNNKKSGYEKFVGAFEKVDPHSPGRAFESDPLFLLMVIIDHGLET